MSVAFINLQGLLRYPPSDRPGDRGDFLRDDPGPGLNRPDPVEMRKFARKYLKRNPGADENALRKALRTVYLPEPPVHDPDMKKKVGCLLGLGGMLGVAFGEQIQDERNAQQCKWIEDRIDEVIRRVMDRG